MESVKYSIKGSSYVGVFATATDNLVFVGSGLTDNNKKLLTEILGCRVVEMSVSGSDLVGLFARANSNGIVVSSLMMDDEVEVLKSAGLGINIGVIDSDLNAIGSNVLCNDKIAVVNSDYRPEAMKQIGDTLGVEVIKARIGGFRTVGANNILTNKGLVVSNRCTDQEKEKIENWCGFRSEKTTANTGSLYIGLSVAANSKAVVAGDDTTGYELQRIVDGLTPDQ